MAKFLIRILLFSILLNFLILLIPVSPRLQLSRNDKDCQNRALWIYDRSVNNQADIDVAFFGSSRTINAIDDSLLTSRLDSLNFVNFAYCRFGNNLNLTFINLLLENKKVKSIVLEIRADENRYSHPLFPIYASRSDILNSGILFNKDLLSDFFRHQHMRIQTLLDAVLYKNEIGVNHTLYGFSPQTIQLEENIAQKALTENVKFLKPRRKFETWFYSLYPKTYLDRISAVCSEHRVKLNFIYLPQFGMPLEKPIHTDYFHSLGRVISPPSEITYNRKYWADENHLNSYGAHFLSEWLLNEIEKKPI